MINSRICSIELAGIFCQSESFLGLFVLGLRFLHFRSVLIYLHFRAFKQTVYVIVLFSGARPCLLWVTVNRNLVRKFSNGGFLLFFIPKIGNLITSIIKIRNITKISRKPPVLIDLFNTVEIEA